MPVRIAARPRATRLRPVRWLGTVVGILAVGVVASQHIGVGVAQKRRKHHVGSDEQLREHQQAEQNPQHGQPDATTGKVERKTLTARGGLWEPPKAEVRLIG